MDFYKDLVLRPFKTKEHYCADGFPKEGNECFVVITSPMKENHIYQGIKQTVLMIDQSKLQKLEVSDKDDIQLQDEDNKLDKLMTLPRKNNDIPQLYPINTN